MGLPFCCQDCFHRAVERKRTLIVFAVLFLLGGILGAIFIKTPAIYDYHLNLCDRFIGRVCFSDKSVFVIFLERTAGNAVFLALIIIAGVHPVGLAVPPAVLVFRAYTFGGSVAVFFSVYGVSGALIALVLYIPVHLLLDVVFLCATSISCGRAGAFRFCKGDFRTLALDFLVLLILVALICLLEMILLLALFHPIGNLL